MSEQPQRKPQGAAALFQRLRANKKLLLWAGVTLDLVVVLVIIGIRWQAQLREVPEPALLGGATPPSWWWSVGWIGDWTLFPGPDAGHWAVDVQKWLDGEVLDRNRPPVYTTLVGAATLVLGDLVFAGHMVNHLLSLLLCLVSYALGRATSGRGPAMAVALMVASSPLLLDAKSYFGVDPTQQLAILLLALMTWWAARGPWWTLAPAGLAVGLAAAAHYLSMAFAVPAALLLLLADRPLPGDDQGRLRLPLPRGLRAAVTRATSWFDTAPAWVPGWLSCWFHPYRLVAPAVALGLGYLCWRLWMMRHPEVALWHVMDVYSEGIATYSGSGNENMMTFSQAVQMVRERLGGALGKVEMEVLRPWAQPAVSWKLLAGFGLLGLLGPGLLRRQDSRLGWDWRPGLWILVFLLPLVGLAASRTPGRYYLYALPLVFLAVMRGVASLAAGGEYLLQKKLPRWPRGALAVLFCLPVALWFAVDFHDRWDLRYPVDRGIYNARVGTSAKKIFGKNGCIITRSQEILFYSGRLDTLAAPCAQYEARALTPCLRRILQECPRSQEIPYVLEDNTRYGPGDRPNLKLQALVRENFKVVGRVKYKSYAARIFRIKRHILEAVLLQSITP